MERRCNKTLATSKPVAYAALHLGRRLRRPRDVARVADDSD